LTILERYYTLSVFYLFFFFFFSKAKREGGKMIIVSVGLSEESPFGLLLVGFFFLGTTIHGEWDEKKRERERETRR
jgi:hypothetical protein